MQYLSQSQPWGDRIQFTTILLFKPLLLYHTIFSDPVMLQPEQDQLDYADAFDISLEDLIGDLKNIMNKDICKKMVTQSAYKFFESWWSNEQDKSKVLSPFEVY